MSNETIGICFLARPCFDKYSTAIYKSMIDLNCKVLGSFITSNEKESETVVKALEGEKIEIYEVSRFFEAHWNEFTFDKFVEYENEYECAPLWKYVYTDRFLINQDYEYCIKITAGYFMFFEKIYSLYCRKEAWSSICFPNDSSRRFRCNISLLFERSVPNGYAV